MTNISESMHPQQIEAVALGDASRIVKPMASPHIGQRNDGSVSIDLI